ncbi:Hypothetical protein HVR_LOCUS1062 [uncultured virus]|nr:Hypothetical protein HVR_LOCUS1062 [uncultured virus]
MDFFEYINKCHQIQSKRDAELERINKELKITKEKYSQLLPYEDELLLKCVNNKERYVEFGEAGHTCMMMLIDQLKKFDIKYQINERYEYCHELIYNLFIEWPTEIKSDNIL